MQMVLVGNDGAHFIHVVVGEVANTGHQNQNESGRFYLCALVGKILNQIVDLKQVGTEKYGRLLAEVWLGNENVCEWMLAQGHAVPYNGGTKTEQQWSS